MLNFRILNLQKEIKVSIIPQGFHQFLFSFCHKKNQDSLPAEYDFVADALHSNLHVNLKVKFGFSSNLLLNIL